MLWRQNCKPTKKKKTCFMFNRSCSTHFQGALFDTLRSYKAEVVACDQRECSHMQAFWTRQGFCSILPFPTMWQQTVLLGDKLCFLEFINLHGVNPLSMADFKVPVYCYWTQSWEEWSSSHQCAVLTYVHAAGIDYLRSRDHSMVK